MSGIKFGVLTVSDRCFYEGLGNVSGAELADLIKKTFENVQVEARIVPDEIPEIKQALLSLANDKCDIILTTGGTGFAPRDVTPEATKAVIEKEAPGIAYAMISKSLEITEKAMLSRAVCGIYKKTLIVNLPGSPKAATECFNFIRGTLNHAVELLRDDKEGAAKTHKELTGKSVTYSQENNESGNLVKRESPNLTSTVPNSTEVTFTPSKVKLTGAANRHRTSPYPMLEVDAASDIIINQCAPTSEVEIVPYEQSINRILAEEIYALEPIPPFNASIKDGYAVKSTDVQTMRTVRDVIAAGDKPDAAELQSGEAIRISTGAPVPPGADAVIQVEDTEVIEKSPDGRELSISIKKLSSAGQDIRSIGSDVAQGSVVLNIFDRITSAHVGVLAMLGKTEVKVFKKPSIGLLSTGNEIKDPRESLQPGQIRDANKACLIHLLRKYGFESQDYGIIKDEPNTVKLALEKAFSRNNVIITTGGVSMGEFDILKQVLVEDFSAVIHFGRVNMKPGKPTTFATLKYEGNLKLFFGLPGNPVSCNVTSLLFVIPTLKYLERSKTYKFPVVSVLASDLINNDPRPEYHRLTVSITADGRLLGTSTGNQISSRLNSMVGANGLALVLKVNKSNSEIGFASRWTCPFCGHCHSKIDHPSICQRCERGYNGHYKVIIFDDIVCHKT